MSDPKVQPDDNKVHVGDEYTISADMAAQMDAFLKDQAAGKTIFPASSDQVPAIVHTAVEAHCACEQAKPKTDSSM